MDPELKLPVDLLSVPTFRRLRDLFREAWTEMTPDTATAKALLAWFILYRELYYKAQEGKLPGRMPAADMPSAIVEMEATGCFRREELEGLAEKLVSPVGLFSRDGDDFICSRFILEHTGVASQRTNSQRGGDLRSYTRGAQKARDFGGAQLSLLVPDERYKDPATGEPLTPDEKKRVNMVILCCDRALFQNERPVHGFTEGLIADGIKVARQHMDEEIDFVFRQIAAHRGHPYLHNKTAEKILSEFETVAQKLNA